MNIHIPWPAPHKPLYSIFPVFLPFAGCSQRCIFCAQEVQSATPIRPITHALEDMERQLIARLSAHQDISPAPVELAFFGGTFTALPEADLAHCLYTTQKLLAQGIIHTARCSTRPDALTPALLRRLYDAGIRTVELGIQSFSAEALHATRRGYTPDTAIRTCHMVREAHLTLGVQLLPGMPTVTEEIFLQDVHTALQCGAPVLRLYPCQVIDHTELAHIWRSGAYTPWTLPQTVITLAKAWLMAELQGVRIIRMGLAPEQKLAQARLAGPDHPALGSMVQSTALYTQVRRMLHAHNVTHILQLHAPKTCQGYFWGYKGELTPAWRELGLMPAQVHWHTQADIWLEGRCLKNYLKNKIH